MNYKNTVEILSAADNPIDIKHSLSALKENNLAEYVFTLNEGMEAFEFIFFIGRDEYGDINNYPKVILLDLKLPKADDIEGFRKIRDDERTKYFPVVVLKSSKEKQDIIGTYVLGVNSYIAKPVQFEKLTKTI